MSDQPDKSLSEKERAEIYYWLAQRARERFTTRQAIEWKVTWGVWTFFGAGSVAVIAADKWKPGGWVPVLIAVISCCLIKSYSDWMKGFVAKGHRIDREEGIFWERKLAAVADPPAGAAFPQTEEEEKAEEDIRAGKIGERSRELCILISWALAAVLFLVGLNAALQPSADSTDKQAAAKKT